MSPSPKQPKRQASASIYILHKNSKLAKYAEAANFAYLSKRTISAETPRGFDLTNGPNQKLSAKKQTHNKCRNAKGLRPYKWYEPKNLRQKSKRTISAETPRGFDLTNGTNQKTFGKKANAQ